MVAPTPRAAAPIALPPLSLHCPTEPHTSRAFGQHLRDAGPVPSTGSVEDCYDHAVAESFFASLKVELVELHDWPTRATARVATLACIEVWYNRQRLHSMPGYLSPAQFETRAQAGIAA